MTENAAQPDKAMLKKPDFYTVKETAQYLRLCEKQIGRLIEHGELPAYRIVFEKVIREYKREN